MYGELLAKYFLQPNVLFVISSGTIEAFDLFLIYFIFCILDFCHWGDRFSYTYYDEKCGEIWQSIEALDRMGMDVIEKKNPNEFKSYLKQYDNTICGNHPISILLNILETVKYTNQYNVEFVQYAQSSKCKRSKDSSVSYASASVVAL
jgi:AmmeMemoRadiSam system protein B